MANHWFRCLQYSFQFYMRHIPFCWGYSFGYRASKLIVARWAKIMDPCTRPFGIGKPYTLLTLAGTDGRISSRGVYTSDRFSCKRRKPALDKGLLQCLSIIQRNYDSFISK